MAELAADIDSLDRQILQLSRQAGSRVRLALALEYLLAACWWSGGWLWMAGVFSHRQSVIEPVVYLAMAALPMVLAMLYALWSRPALLQAIRLLDIRLRGRQLLPSALEQAQLAASQRSALAEQLFAQASRHFSLQPVKVSTLSTVRGAQLILPGLFGIAGMLLFVVSQLSAAPATTTSVKMAQQPFNTPLLAVQESMHARPVAGLEKHTATEAYAPHAIPGSRVSQPPTAQARTDPAARQSAPPAAATLSRVDHDGDASASLEPGARQPLPEAAHGPVREVFIPQQDSRSVTASVSANAAGNSPRQDLAQRPANQAESNTQATDFRAYNPVQRHTIARYFATLRTAP